MTGTFHLPVRIPVSRISRYLCLSCRRSVQSRWAHTKAPGTISTAAKMLEKQPFDPKDYIPKPLARPLGLPDPPKPGENSGKDRRTWRERRDDYFNHDKYIERRQKLAKRAMKPYFRDWSRVNYYKGKTFIAPSRVFRAEKSLYFPNLVGRTLAAPSRPNDTTPIFQNHVSIVSLNSGLWAHWQTRTFTDEKTFPELAALLETEKGLLQQVEINWEDHWLRALIVRMFLGGLRKQWKKEDWGKYFLVRRGLTEEMREAIGMTNAKVGYVYLVDWMCRIRWAGSADAEGEEREGMAACVRKVVEAWKNEKGERLAPREVGVQEKAVQASA